MSELERLHFGARARLRARLKRASVWAWAISLAAMFLGIPGAGLGFELLGQLGGEPRPVITRGVETSESAAGLLRFRRGVFDARPRPTPPRAEEPAPAEVAAAPAPAPAAPAGSITSIIYAAAAEFGLDGGYLLSVASCESGLNPSAYNSAGYHGLFQFDQTTWAAYGYGSIYDPVAQARTAARLIAGGQGSRWPNCA